MWKTVLAATAAVAIAGTTLVYGQQRFNDAGAGPDGPRHWRPSAEDIGAFTEARVAALKAGLKLTADQEKNWPAFEQAYRELAKLRSDRMERRFEQRRDNPGAADQRADSQRDSVNPIERLQREADALTTRGTALKHLADASGPLYQSLDDGQKQRFLLLSRPMGPHHHDHFAFWRMHREQGEER
jgi:hypothetical protein